MTIRVRSGVVSYEVDGRSVDVDDIWHERQFAVSGSVIGLSPTAYAALSLSGYLSAQAFAAQWFAGAGAFPPRC